MYLIALSFLLVTSILIRLNGLEFYPQGFSGHAIVHSQLRSRLYEIIFHLPWKGENLADFYHIALLDQHGMQSLIEALLIPIFGGGFLGSRWIVVTLSLLSISLAIRWGSVVFNKWYGLAVGLSVAMAPYHLVFSRNGEAEHIFVYIFCFLLLLLTHGALVKDRWLDYLLLGGGIGASFYFYAPLQFLVLFLGITFIIVKSQYRSQLGIRSFVRFVAFLGPCCFILAPLLEHYWNNGRIIPIHAPYGSTNYTVSTLRELPDRLGAAWSELFSYGLDPWFSRVNGSLRDWLYLLVLPGAYYLGREGVKVLRMRLPGGGSAQPADQPQSTSLSLKRSQAVLLAVVVTFAMFILGCLPGVLSPEPFFRRMILLAIGMDILIGAGIYWIGVVLLKWFKKTLALPIIITGLAGFVHHQEGVFFSDVKVVDSVSKHREVEISREICRRLKEGKEANLFFAPSEGVLSIDELMFVLNFELNYPKELPREIRFVTLEDLKRELFKELIIPHDSYRWITKRVGVDNQNVVFHNFRDMQIMGRKSFLVVDTFPDIANLIPPEQSK